mmetsp:Transcript_31296/g.63063  ORF Transcript_31296/g.63063 Transcript_31296/m.63063 type:complete len:83 (+) Transcript_31296:508-756(+)
MFVGSQIEQCVVRVMERVINRYCIRNERETSRINDDWVGVIVIRYRCTLWHVGSMGLVCLLNDDNIIRANISSFLFNLTICL